MTAPADRLPHARRVDPARADLDGVAGPLTFPNDPD